MNHTHVLMAGVLASLAVLVIAGDAHARRKHSNETVLVALEKGGAQRLLADKIRTAMDARGMPVSITDYRDLIPDEAERYHAVVIVTDIWNGKPAGKVTNYVRKVAERDKSAITIAAFDNKGEWVNNYHGVEVMNATADDAAVEALAKNIISKLDVSIEKERAEEEKKNGQGAPKQQEDSAQDSAGAK